MKLRDDRTEAQKKTHRLAWVGTDGFMSGWGRARGGLSYAGWAFEDGDSYKVENWVRRRSDMKRVRLVVLDEYHPKGGGDCHIYAVDAKHPAVS